MLRGALLDVGGVFLVPDGAVVGAALAARSIRFEPYFQDAHFAGVAAVDEIGDPGQDEGRYLRGYVRALGVDDEAAAVAALVPVWESPSIGLWRHVLRDSVAGLRSLAERGLRLGIVSNSDGTVEEQLKSSQICQVGDGAGVPVLVIVDSAVVGVAKPDRAIFAPALSALDLDPEQVAFVGDSVRYDVVPAASAGLIPFHFDPLGLCRDRGHEHLRLLGELAART